MERYPPFQLPDYEAGTRRAPYPNPTPKHEPLRSDVEYRTRNYFLDVYRLIEYTQATGAPLPRAEVRQNALEQAQRLVSRQDWALMGPRRLSELNLKFGERQGQAAYNSWVAGAIGLTRCARRYGWENGEQMGIYLFGKLAAARVAQARYVAEMHRTGALRGPAAGDGRSLCHIDTRCALLQWGHCAYDQHFPPFVDLVPEVGRLLHDYARAECRAYLDYLDYAVPFWWLSEAPKQSSLEHRTSPLLNCQGNVLAQYWILGKRGKAFARYVDNSRFTGDLFYLQNVAALLESYSRQ